MTGIDDVLRAARDRAPGALGGHSALYEAMWRDYAVLATELDPPRRPNWRSIAATYAKLGMRDGRGQIVSPERSETVRLTWYKVRRDKRLASAAGRGAALAPDHTTSQPLRRTCSARRSSVSSPAR